MKKFLVAIDSFKGCMSSRDAGKAVADGIRDVFGDSCDIEIIQVADGGEGLLDCFSQRKDFELRHVNTIDAAGNKCTADYCCCHDFAVVEMAQVAGLPQLSLSERNPLLTTTFGVGETLNIALTERDTIILGLGGSATNEVGFGALQALGVRFLNKHNQIIEHPISGGCLGEIYDIDLSQFSNAARNAKWILACDVNNPLTGPDGATFTFAPQKGADKKMLETLEQGMIHIQNMLQSKLGETLQRPGFGAAGGMAGGFYAILKMAGADICLKHGIDIILDAADFNNKLNDAQCVITGEGSIDSQTLHGKTASGILNRCRQKNIPVIAFGGKVTDIEALKSAGFTEIININRTAPHSEPLSETLRLAPQRLRHAVTTHLTGQNDFI